MHFRFCLRLWAMTFAALFLAFVRVTANDVSPAPVPNEAVCVGCRGSGICGGNGCKEGQAICPATCLKRDGPGWIKKKIDGYPDDYIWQEFKWKMEDGRTGYQWFSQHHAGELIEFEPNGKPVSRGRCPTCEGDSRVTCKVCKGSTRCPACVGLGKFIRGKNLFTLTDLQGRALEAAVLGRTAETVTVLRLADEQVFGIPAKNLNAESLAMLDKAFPVTPSTRQ